MLVPVTAGPSTLPRGAALQIQNEQAAAELARHLELEPELVYVEKREDLLSGLLEGRGDLVVANLTVTEERARSVRFSRPVTHVVEQVVARAGDAGIETTADLAGRTLVVRRSSSFWETARRLQQQLPDLAVHSAPEHLDTEQLMHRVAVGEIDLTIADDNLVRSVLAYRPDLRAALDLTEPRPVAWAVRPSAEELARAVDTFLERARLARWTAGPRFDDLPAMQERRVLRMLTRNSPSTYFLHRGDLVGFEYELVKRFADAHQLRLEVVVPPDGADLLDWLVQGLGDVVASGLTITDSRSALPDVRWTIPTNTVTEQLVARPDDPVHDLESLAGRTVTVPPGSAYLDTLEALRQRGIDVQIATSEPDQRTENLIDAVADARIDLTVADSTILAIELTYRDDVRAALSLTEEQPVGWAVRSTSPRLRAALDEHLAAEVGQPTYNVIRRRYFVDRHGIAARVTARVAQGGSLSPYDPLVKRIAAEYDVDWRLVVAQMFQESGFDPQAVSWSGARGLMQLKPEAAREVGFDDVHDPEQGIEAGIRYLTILRDRIEPTVDPQARWWFALAGYNAGFGHVIDARRLAAEQGLDPNRWFDHTEKAMLLLSEPEYARNARYGYIRGAEPVSYVRRIRERYGAYVDATDGATTATP